jgi:predicted Rossmann fold flavoprotein
MVTTEKVYDVIVVGGGPAGMMAAAHAAERGAQVLLLEKNPDVGKKLLITGGGRCNITNAEFDTRTLLAHYKSASNFLFSAFAKHTVQDTLTYFSNRGLETKVEAEKRAFPITDSARSVYDVLKKHLAQTGVTVRPNSIVTKLLFSKDQITGLQLLDGTTLMATSYILATGGISRPETGSTGDGFSWLRLIGHTVHTADASLVPLALKEPWVKELAGITLPDVKLSIYQNQEKQKTKRGKLLFTHVGASGPTILNLSKYIGELLEYGTVTIGIDLFPDDDEKALDQKLITLFSEHANKQFKNVLSPFLPTNLANGIVSQGTIPPDLPCHSITKEARKALGTKLKHLTVTVSHLLGVDKAIVTSGGVDLTEIDFRTMVSRKYTNLYVIGDLLNIDRPSGGYSLQLCWTTGYVAGTSVPVSARR